MYSAVPAKSAFADNRFVRSPDTYECAGPGRSNRAYGYMH